MATHNAGSQRRSKRRIMRALKINEISAVNHPAQVGATALILKRRDEPADSISQTDETAKASAMTTEQDGHTHLLRLNGPPDGVELNSGETSFIDGHDHPWIRDASGSITIGVSHSPEGEPHTHTVAIVSKDEKNSSVNLIGKETEGENVGTNQGVTNIMTDKTKKADDELQAVTARADKAEAALKTAEAYGSLTDAQKAYHDGLDPQLDDDKRKDFVSKSADERQKVLDGIEAQKRATDAGKNVIYKSTDGDEYTADDDPRLVAQAKRGDDLTKQLADAEYIKRAGVELSHMPGDVDTHVALLKSIDGIKDDGQRTKALGALKAQDAVMANAFKTNGVGSGAEPVSSSAEDELDKMAKQYATDNKVTYAAAYDKVVQSDEGRPLYAVTTGDDQIGKQPLRIVN